MAFSFIHRLAELTYNYSYSSDSGVSTTSSAGGLVVLLIIGVIALWLIISLWKVFKKAGKPGWASIVPIYNTWVLFEIAGKPGWYALLGLIPFVGGLILLVLLILAYIEIAKRFGKGAGFAILLLLLPFIGWPILAFGKAQYNGGSGGTPAAPVAQSNPGAPVIPAQPLTNPQPPATPDDTAPPPSQPPQNPQPPQTPPSGLVQ